MISNHVTELHPDGRVFIKSFNGMKKFFHNRIQIIEDDDNSFHNMDFYILPPSPKFKDGLPSNSPSIDYYTINYNGVKYSSLNFIPSYIHNTNIKRRSLNEVKHLYQVFNDREIGKLIVKFKPDKYSFIIG